MKRAISLLLAIVMMTIALAGCGKKTDKFIGTWKVDSVEIDGAKFTVSELKAMGDDSMCAAQIVIKTGGKAYVAECDDGTGDVVDWQETDTGIQIGEQNCTIVDGMICLKLKYDDEMI